MWKRYLSPAPSQRRRFTVSDEQSKRGWLSWWIGAAVLLPLLYVLSVGPAAVVMGRSSPGGWVFSAIGVVYSPLEWLHGHTSLDKPLEWYRDLWRR
jgi:hypothetical protein